MRAALRSATQPKYVRVPARSRLGPFKAEIQQLLRAIPSCRRSGSARQGRLRVPRQLELRDASRRRLDSLIALIDDFDREITQTTREIEQRARADDRVDVLTQIRGVGRYTAMLIIAEVGDITRFPSARHLCGAPVELWVKFIAAGRW